MASILLISGTLPLPSLAKYLPPPRQHQAGRRSGADESANHCPTESLDCWASLFLTAVLSYPWVEDGSKFPVLENLHRFSPKLKMWWVQGQDLSVR